MAGSHTDTPERESEREGERERGDADQDGVQLAQETNGGEVSNT